MKICISGPTGFIGSALTRYWAQAGHQLMLLVRTGSNTKRINDVLRKYNSSVRMEIVTDNIGLNLALENFKPDVIVHTACSYGREPYCAVDLLKANVLYGLELLNNLAQICDSTHSTFINFDSALNPNVNSYAFSKSQYVIWAKEVVRKSKNNIQFINLRLQQIYGPNDDDSKFVMKVIKDCLNCELKLQVTHGEQKRDFIYVEDVVQACDTVLNARKTLPQIHDIDLGTGQAVSIRHYINLVRQMTRSSTRIEFGAVPYRDNEQMLCVADTKEILRLGWLPRYTLEDGLREVISKTKGERSL